jgi:hypothetical protein
MALAFAHEREGPSPIPTDHRQRPENASFQAVVASIDIFLKCRLSASNLGLDSRPARFLRRFGAEMRRH